MIEVKGINQSYDKHGHKKTLDNINLTLKENAVTALVGANGAGKSTLLGVITGLIPSMSGDVFIGGVKMTHMKTKEVAKSIAVLRQTHNISIRITVRDLIEFGRFPHCGGRLREEDHAKVDEAITYMNLGELSGRFLDELSGGQKQRAFIAMILAQDTPYVFFDEPLNNLDIKYSVEMMKIITKLADDLGKTVIVVLHDINFASAYADHIIAMKGGRIVNEGSPKKIITKSVLDGVFDHDFHIAEHDGKNICLYYDNPAAINAKNAG